jgi:peroxiredoxin
MLNKLLLGIAAAMIVAASPAFAAPEVGQPAPDFTGTDTHGVEHSLSDFKGKSVVLEWTNHECPYVHKHYDSGNMQKLQETATADGVIWLTIASSAEGKQGQLSNEDANIVMKEQGAKPTARIQDPSGEIGKLYGAKTTPHMFVIDPEGTLVYAGAIDSNKSFDPATIEGADNYVMDALAAIKAGEPVKVASTTPYGCSVKY